MSWYVLQVQSLYENKVIEAIAKRQSEGRLETITRVFSPEIITTEYKDGKKIERKKRLLSNYIYLQMDYTDEAWHILKAIRGVQKFLGNGSKPTILADSEIERLEKEINSDTPKPKVIYDINTDVRIINGPFSDFVGVIKSVDYEKNKAEVEVQVFGRETKVEMELNSLEISKE